MEKLYSTTEAAEALNISTRRIAVLCTDGRFPGAQKIGKTWAIPESAIKSYVPGERGVHRSRPKRLIDILKEAGYSPPPDN